MNNTILMVWSEGLCRQFCSLIKWNVFVSGPGKAASYRYRISRHCLQVDKTNKGNETIQCNNSVCVELGIPYHRPSLIKHKCMKPPIRLCVKKHFHMTSITMSLCQPQKVIFNAGRISEDIFRAEDIRKHQYLKSHYHETPFLSLNYKSMNSLIYL